MKNLFCSFAVGTLLFSLPATATHVTAKASSVSAKSAPAEETGDDLSARLVVGSQNEAAATAAVAAPAVQPAPAVAAEAAIALPPETASKPTETAKLPEDQIPVLTGVKDPKKASGGGMTRIFISLGVLTAALGAAVFGLKRISKRGAEKNKNTRIKVLTQHALGPKKSLAIVQVAGESILIGITDHNISMLKSLALIDDEFPEEMPRDFNHALDDLEEDTTPSRSRAALASDQDDFAVQGLSEIRDKVSTRLRSMKNL